MGWAGAARFPKWTLLGNRCQPTVLVNWANASLNPVTGRMLRRDRDLSGSRRRRDIVIQPSLQGNVAPSFRKSARHVLSGHPDNYPSTLSVEPPDAEEIARAYCVVMGIEFDVLAFSILLKAPDGHGFQLSAEKQEQLYLIYFAQGWSHAFEIAKTCREIPRAS